MEVADVRVVDVFHYVDLFLEGEFFVFVHFLSKSKSKLGEGTSGRF